MFARLSAELCDSNRITFNLLPNEDWMFINSSKWRAFRSSQLTQSSLRFVCYRVTLALVWLVWFYIGILVQSPAGVIFSGSPPYWLIYVTNWTFLLGTVNYTLLAALSLRAHLSAKTPSHLNEKRVRNSNCAINKFTWWLNGVATSGNFGSSLLYFLVLYPFSKNSDEEFSILLHGLNLALVLLDMVIADFPIRIYHGLYSVAIGGLYAVFSLVYYMAGGTNENGNIAIYPPLNWEKNFPLAVGVSCGNLVFLSVAQVVLWAVFHEFKLWLQREHHQKEAQRQQKPSQKRD